MIVLNLIKHEWLNDLRSSTWGRKIALKVLFAFFILYMVANLLVIGYVLDLILTKVYPEQTPLHSLHSWLIYGLGAIMIMRFFMEKVPLLAIRPYLPLNISKNQLTHFFLTKAFLGLFNWLPVFMLIPFAVKVLPTHLIPGWLLIIVGMMLLLNMALLLLKKQFGERILVFIGIALAIAAIGVAGIAGWLPVNAWSATIFNAAYNYQWLSLPILALLFTGAYLFTHSTFKSACYLDAMPEQQAAGGAVDKRLSLLEGLGDSGPLIVQELRLILRNKRPRTVVFLSFFFLLYGFILLAKEYIDTSPFMMLFGCYFMTLIFLSNYGQFTFSWESNHWDGLLAWKLSFERMIKAKWVMYAGFAVFFTVLAMPYGYFSSRIPVMLIAVAIFQVGCNIPLILLISSQNKKRITLNKSAAFNWEGTGGSQFLMMIPLMILPFVIFGPFQILISIEAGLIALAATGLISILFYKQWIREISKNMRSRKHITATGFRQE